MASESPEKFDRSNNEAVSHPNILLMRFCVHLLGIGGEGGDHGKALPLLLVQKEI